MNVSRTVSRLILAVALILGSGALAEGQPSMQELRLSMRQTMLKRINADRQKHDLPPVELDVPASLIADAYCERQINEGTTGHFTLDGVAPYMRYSFAGGRDGVSENAAAWSANYRFTEKALPELALRSQATMLAEVPPFDGHRRTILDPYATHVGIGFAWRDGEFRMTQEFVRRYVSWIQTPSRNATIGEHAMLRGRPVSAGNHVAAISVHHEPFPRPLSVQAANLIDSYALPDQRREYRPRLGVVTTRERSGQTVTTRHLYEDGSSGDFHVGEDGVFSLAVPFTDGPGIYTVVTWLADRNGQMFSASNISIRVAAAVASRETAASR